LGVEPVYKVIPDELYQEWKSEGLSGEDMEYAARRLTGNQVNDRKLNEARVGWDGDHTVVIYPGGFHPFHPGHKAVYDHLKKTFPDDPVFVASTNSQSERPFTFEEKKDIAGAMGIDPDAIVRVQHPYRATEITDKYDMDKDHVIYVISTKDKARLKDDEYMLPYKKGMVMEPFRSHAYYYSRRPICLTCWVERCHPAPRSGTPILPLVPKTARRF
jgi:glycerol-3-phosphate cytidylyltransferase-like family protein